MNINELIEIVKSKDNIIFLSEKLFENDALVFKNINSNSIKLKYFEKDYLIISYYNFTVTLIIFFLQ